MTGYKINSPRCGRDRRGVSHCECGRCAEIVKEVKKWNKSKN